MRNSNTNWARITSMVMVLMKTWTRRCVGIVWLPNRAMLRHRTNLDYVMKRAGACLCVLKRQFVGIVWLLSREMQMGSFT